MTQKIWLAAYETGVPYEISEDFPDSLVNYFRQCCERYPRLPAIKNFGVSLSYQQLAETAEAFAGYLQHRLGLNKGDRIALMLPNLLHYPVALLGALQAGLIVVNFNPLYTSHELLAQLKDCGAAAIVLFAGCAQRLQAIIAETAVPHVIIAHIGDLMPWPKGLWMDFAAKHLKKRIPPWDIPKAISFKRALQQGGALRPVQISADDIAFIQYTGGTTGTPKGAMLSHRNIVANIQQTYLWIRRHVREGEERVIVALPLYHIFGLTINFLSHLKFGSEHILIADPRNIPALVAELKASRFSVLAGVNALFAKLLKNDEFKQLDFADLRLVVGGGEAIKPSVAEQWQRVTGKPICQAYGLTEASPGICCNPLYLDDFNGTVGVPIPSTEVEIRSEDDAPLPPGEPGELWVKGPQVMQGYWNNPHATEQVLTPDGWLRTGDIATMDEKGYIRIVDRKKDMIIVSGFKVYPNEIESLLTAHPGVAEAAVVGQVDETAGEIVTAFIVKKDPSLKESDIERYCRENLTPYKVPRKIVFLDELPKSPIGKVLRRHLRAP